MKNLDILIKELIKLPTETEWVEFKVNNYTPEIIGTTLCALANAATFNYKSYGYMVFGIDDKTHEVVGTSFDYRTYKKGNEEIENWLHHKLSDNAMFEFYQEDVDGKNIVVIRINKAVEKTVMFDKIEYVRVGSYVKKLNDNPSMKAQLWDRLRSSKFEDLPAKEDLSDAEVFELLNISVYYGLLKKRHPESQAAILHDLKEENIIIRQDNGLYTITNLGALLFAKKLSDFSSLSRKAVRVVQYEGKDKFVMLKDFVGNKGYAVGFEGLLQFISALLPSKEIIEGAVRRTQSAYPSIAIREAIANAIIHQDLSISGTSPVVEIYSNRVEIINPGKPLIDIDRIIDNPPKSRNEKIASLMRRMKMCEELGTGWDKIVKSCEMDQLPAPKIWLYEENTKVAIYTYVSFTEMSIEDKKRACVFHASLQYIKGESMTNSSLRERFGLPESSSASISRLIKDCVNEKIIKPLDPQTAPKHMKYVPKWA